MGHFCASQVRILISFLLLLRLESIFSDSSSPFATPCCEPRASPFRLFADPKLPDLALVAFIWSLGSHRMQPFQARLSPDRCSSDFHIKKDTKDRANRKIHTLSTANFLLVGRVLRRKLHRRTAPNRLFLPRCEPICRS